MSDDDSVGEQGNSGQTKRKWSRDEDEKLYELVVTYGANSWSNISSKLPGRNSKQCRERWNQQLNPEIRKGNWTTEEDIAILGHPELVGKWAKLAKFIPGRSDNDVRNRFNALERHKSSKKESVKNHVKDALNLLQMSKSTRSSSNNKHDDDHEDDDEDDDEPMVSFTKLIGKSSNKKNNEKNEKKTGKTKKTTKVDVELVDDNKMNEEDKEEEVEDEGNEIKNISTKSSSRRKSEESAASKKSVKSTTSAESKDNKDENEDNDDSDDDLDDEEDDNDDEDDDVKNSKNKEKGSDSKLTKQSWSADEDQLLLRLIQTYGPKCWPKIGNLMPGRSARQCRERWHHKINPDLKKGNWTLDEDKIIIKNRSVVGSWAKLAKLLPGRNDNDVRNRYYALERLSSKHGTGDHIKRNLDDAYALLDIAAVSSKDSGKPDGVDNDDDDENLDTVRTSGSKMTMEELKVQSTLLSAAILHKNKKQKKLNLQILAEKSKDTLVKSHENSINMPLNLANFPPPIMSARSDSGGGSMNGYYYPPPNNQMYGVPNVSFNPLMTSPRPAEMSPNMLPPSSYANYNNSQNNSPRAGDYSNVPPIIRNVTFQVLEHPSLPQPYIIPPAQGFSGAPTFLPPNAIDMSQLNHWMQSPTPPGQSNNPSAMGGSGGMSGPSGPPVPMLPTVRVAPSSPTTTHAHTGGTPRAISGSLGGGGSSIFPSNSEISNLKKLFPTGSNNSNEKHSANSSASATPRLTGGVDFSQFNHMNNNNNNNNNTNNNPQSPPPGYYLHQPQSQSNTIQLPHNFMTLPSPSGGPTQQNNPMGHYSYDPNHHNPMFIMPPPSQSQPHSSGQSGMNNNNNGVGQNNNNNNGVGQNNNITGTTPRLMPPLQNNNNKEGEHNNNNNVMLQPHSNMDMSNMGGQFVQIPGQPYLFYCPNNQNSS